MRQRGRWNCFVGAGVCLLMLGWLLGPLLSQAHALKLIPAQQRFHFTIDPKTPVKDLLPVPPAVAAPLPPWLVKDWTQVPEIRFQKPAAAPMPAPQEAMKETAHVIARINFLNEKDSEHFLKTLIQHRTDLLGLPFIMGDDCKQTRGRSRAFVQEVNLVRAGLQVGGLIKEGRINSGGPAVANATQFWNSYEQQPRRRNQEDSAAQIAALMQMLAPEETGMRQGLVKKLSDIEGPEATRALARLAVFSVEKEVRQAALDALKARPRKDATEVLLAGLRYPWPAVAANAGEALTTLGRKDLVPQLVTFLDEPDPRAPADKEVNGKATLAVREVVRVNHHQNCLLCHAPGNTKDVPLDRFAGSTEVVVGEVPTPGLPLKPPSQGYGSSSSPDILVRVDVTYLRQDFSMKMPVKNAGAWPEQQRFDFLVRTRPVTAAEIKAYRKWEQKQGKDYLSPNHQAALKALTALTGRKASEPTSQAWRAALAD